MYICGLLDSTLDTKGECAVLPVTIDGDILVEWAGTSCRVVGDCDLPLLAWSDRLTAILRGRAGAGSGHTCDD